MSPSVKRSTSLPVKGLRDFSEDKMDCVFIFVGLVVSSEGPPEGMTDPSVDWFLSSVIAGTEIVDEEAIVVANFDLVGATVVTRTVVVWTTGFEVITLDVVNGVIGLVVVCDNILNVAAGVNFCVGRLGVVDVAVVMLTVVLCGISVI